MFFFTLSETNTGTPVIHNPDSTLATFGEHQLIKMNSIGTNGVRFLIHIYRINPQLIFLNFVKDS